MLQAWQVLFSAAVNDETASRPIAVNQLLILGSSRQKRVIETALSCWSELVIWKDHGLNKIPSTANVLVQECHALVPPLICLAIFPSSSKLRLEGDPK